MKSVFLTNNFSVGLILTTCLCGHINNNSASVWLETFFLTVDIFLQNP